MIDDMTPNHAGRLQRYVQRIESLEEEKKVLSEDIKEIYNEAKAVGFDPKIMRQIIRLRTMDPQQRSLHEELIQAYMRAMEAPASTDGQ